MKQIPCQNISPYLMTDSKVIVCPVKTPLFGQKQMLFGNMPRDGGFLIIDSQKDYANASAINKLRPYILPFLGSEELLTGKKRWCLWLVNAPQEIFQIQFVLSRLEKCRLYRLASKADSTRELAKSPHLFGQLAQQETSSCLVAPRHFTEHAFRMPVDMVDSGCIVGDACSFIPDGDIIDFAFLSSVMYMAWVKCICGRLEARLRHSISQCYNTFPFLKLDENDRLELAEICERILAERRFLQIELIRLCRNETVPDSLKYLYRKLDLKIDSMYNPDGFTFDRERLECLLRMYEEKTSRIPADINQWC